MVKTIYKLGSNEFTTKKAIDAYTRDLLKQLYNDSETVIDRASLHWDYFRDLMNAHYRMKDIDYKALYIIVNPRNDALCLQYEENNTIYLNLNIIKVLSECDSIR